MTSGPHEPPDARWQARYPPAGQAPAQLYVPAQYQGPDRYPSQAHQQAQYQAATAPQYRGHDAAPYRQQTVAPRSPALGLLLSFFIPGLGSMVNGRAGMGVLILALYIVGAILIFFVLGIAICLGVWIWGMVDGYKSAQSWNRAHGIIS